VINSFLDNKVNVCCLFYFGHVTLKWKKNFHHLFNICSAADCWHCSHFIWVSGGLPNYTIGTSLLWYFMAHMFHSHRERHGLIVGWCQYIHVDVDLDHIIYMTSTKICHDQMWSLGRWNLLVLCIDMGKVDPHACSVKKVLVCHKQLTECQEKAPELWRERPRTLNISRES